jgi:acetoin utilization protein AcuB
MTPIADVMTCQPWTVQLDDSLAVARRMVAEREIHHLPVLDGSVVVGMVDERGLAGAGDRLGVAADVVVPVHIVPETTPLDEVLDAMVAGRWDAVVVTRDGTVAGIFTASDAVRLLRDVLRDRRCRLDRPQ